MCRRCVAATDGSVKLKTTREAKQIGTNRIVGQTPFSCDAADDRDFKRSLKTTSLFTRLQCTEKFFLDSFVLLQVFELATGGGGCDEGLLTEPFSC